MNQPFTQPNQGNQPNNNRAPILVKNCLVGNNPGVFTAPIPLKLEILASTNFMGKCMINVSYAVGESQKDQKLAQSMIGPFQVGMNSFVIKANSPNPKGMTKENLLGNGILLVEGYFNDQKFIHVGFFVNNEYPANLDENKVNIQNVKRNILSNKPKVTTYDINWS